MRLFYIIISVLFLSCADMGGEYIETVKNRNNPDLVDIASAKKQVSSALFSVFAQCPEFNNSGLNPGLNWALMLGSNSCGTYATNSPDFLTGCADKDFVNKESLNLCLGSIAAMHCKVSGANIFGMYFLAYASCGDALHSTTFPFMFF